MSVEHRQKRDRDAGASGRGQDSIGHFRRLIVGLAVGGVVEVVKLGDGCESRLQHLDIGLRGDRLHVVRRHHQREAIHGLAPGPERIRLLGPDFGKSGHGALEGVAVQVRRRRGQDRVTLVALLRWRSRLHGAD